MIRPSECQTPTQWGGCCCACAKQIEIVGHPWNENPEMKQSITTVVGYGCGAMAETIPTQVIFLDKKHGFCEMFQRRSEQ